MTSNVLLRYLIGEADAIRLVAASSHAIFVGGLFVLSAGLARTWQRHDLKSRPWMLGIPFVASIVAMTIFVQLLLLFVGWPTDGPRGVFQVWASMLGLFWMTAPLAWLYGIPFERFATRIGAVKFRLWTLLVVSVWRVVLMIRVLVVSFHVPDGAATLFVLVAGSVVALAALKFTKPRRPESIPTVVLGMASIAPAGARENRVIQSVTGCLTPMLWIFLLTALPVLWFSDIAAGQLAIDPPTIAVLSATPGLWGLAAGAVLFWCVWLPRAQRRQQLRTRVESLMSGRKLSEAVELLRSCPQAALPDQWVPPIEQSLSGGDHEPLLTFTSAIQSLPSTSWVKSVSEPIFLEYVRDPILYWFDDERAQRVVELLEVVETPREAVAAALNELDDLKSATEESARMFGPVQDDDTDADLFNDPNFIMEWPAETPLRLELMKRLKMLAGKVATTNEGT